MHRPKVFIYIDNGKTKLTCKRTKYTDDLEHSEEKFLGMTHFNKYKDTKQKHMLCKILKSKDKDNNEKSTGLKLRQQ